MTVSQKFLDLCLTKGTDAPKPKEIFDAIQKTLDRYEIPWDNCIAFGVDNINSNIGAKNSIKVTVVNPSVYFVSCPCHIIHNVAQLKPLGKYLESTMKKVRWLSLQNAVERILQMFAASTSYFKSEG